MEKPQGGRRAEVLLSLASAANVLYSKLLRHRYERLDVKCGGCRLPDLSDSAIADFSFNNKAGCPLNRSFLAHERDTCGVRDGFETEIVNDADPA